MLRTTTDKLFERCARCAFAGLLALLLLACGPSGGGTGTGPILKTYSGTSIQPPMAIGAPGNCNPNCGAADLVLEQDLVQFASDCRLFSYSGPWSLNAGTSLSLRGTLATSAGNTRTVVPATLELHVGPEKAAGPDVSASVLDEAGRLVLGPFNLQSGAAIAPAFASCPAN